MRVMRSPPDALPCPRRVHTPDTGAVPFGCSWNHAVPSRSVSSLFGMTCRGQAPKLARMVATAFFFGVARDLRVGASRRLSYILRLGSGSDSVCVQFFALSNNTFVSFHIYHKSSFGDLVLEVELLSVIFLKTQCCHFFS